MTFWDISILKTHVNTQYKPTKIGYILIKQSVSKMDVIKTNLVIKNVVFLIEKYF